MGTGELIAETPAGVVSGVVPRHLTRQTPSSIRKGEIVKAYGLTVEEIRELVDAVAIVEEASGVQLEEDTGGILAHYYNEQGLRPLDLACARLALALGDDRPEFRETLARAEFIGGIGFAR